MISPEKRVELITFILLIGALLIIVLSVVGEDQPTLQSQVEETSSQHIVQDEDIETNTSAETDADTLPYHVDDDVSEDELLTLAVPGQDTSFAEETTVTEDLSGTDTPVIVVIIDDLGLSTSALKTLADLPGPMTFAFLPYADASLSLSDYAYKKGHEIMIHMPMEAMNTKLDLGDIALRTGQTADEINEQLGKAFKRVSHYVGMNNHMGSKLTQDADAMEIVMTRLEEEGLLFVDSRTISTSVAEEIADQHNIPHATRDIFIDHVATEAFVHEALADAERLAKEEGVAVIIGHPKAVTINALSEWLPTLQDKGIRLAPVSAIVTR